MSTTTKAKSASKQIAVAPKTDPRTAMKLVRSEIAHAVKNRQRVDLMGFNNDDIPRAMIAMQDMIDLERTKKAKASGHIVNMRDIISGMGHMLTSVMVTASARELEKDEQIAYLQKQLNEHDDTSKELSEVKEKLEASLTTIQTIMEGF